MTLTQNICPNRITLRILLRLELWPDSSKNQLQKSNTTQLHLTWNWENSQEKRRWLSEKSIHITNSDNPSSFWSSNKKSWGNTLVDFSKEFDSIHWGKIDQILIAYCLPREIVAAIVMLYKNTKVKVRSPNGDTYFFDIVAGVLQRGHISTIPVTNLRNGGARGVVVIVVGNGHGNTSSNPGRYWLHFT